MQARGPLMMEHRLIERMIAFIQRTLGWIESAGSADPQSIDAIVDFIRVYADRTHHGKEEQIFFRDLAKKELSSADRRVLDELIAEHIFGRETTRALAAANDRYRAGDATGLADIASRLRALADFYPKHIEKEDRVLFPAARNYFSDEEEQTILAEFWEFDRQMIHEKYRAVVSALMAG